MSVKFNVEYTATLATGQQVRLIGAIPADATEDQVKRALDEMDFHATRLRERSEIIAMEEKQAQQEHLLEQAKLQKNAVTEQLAGFENRARAPTNLTNNLKSAEINIEVLTEQIGLIREMINERKARTASVYP